ncbi:MAG: hypothetical protein ACRC6B_02325, partial [Fusobacteriaceae bacterium]
CLNLIELQNFKSKYTVIIFEMLKRYNNNIPKLEISKLKKILSYPETYNNFDVKRRVLEQIKKELFQKNNIVLDWEIEKIGTTWKSIKFSAVQFTEATEKNELSEKMIKAIEKARKNRFVDLVYSQKAMDKIIEKYKENDVIKGLNELHKYNSEIKNFSKILISKIDDIKNSKMELIQKKAKIEVKAEVVKPIKSELDLEKEKLSTIIMQSALATSKKIHLFGELSKIETFEELEKFKNEIKF